MTLTFGRVTLPDEAVDSVTITGTDRGDTITLSGDFVDLDPTYGAQSAVLTRDALLGHGPANLDEPVIPVVWDADDRVSGWFRVESLSVETPPGGYETGRIVWTAALRRVASAGLEFEVVTHGGFRSGGAVTDGEIDHLVALPFYGLIGSSNDIPARFHSVGSSSTNHATRYVPGGTNNTNTSAHALNLRAGTGIKDSATIGHLGYIVTPELHYATAARIVRRLADPAPAFPVVGRDPVAGWTGNGNWLGGLYLDNGLFRVHVDQYLDELVLQMHAASETGTTVNGLSLGASLFIPHVTLASGATADGITPADIRILRNSPEEVAVRIVGMTTHPVATRHNYVTVDISLRRGEPFVRCLTAVRGIGFSGGERVGVNITEGGSGYTLIDGGVRLNYAYAGQNHRAWMGSPDASGAGGRFLSSSGSMFMQGPADENVLRWSAGIEPRGTSAPADAAAEELCRNSHSTVVERSRAVLT